MVFDKILELLLSVDISTFGQPLTFRTEGDI